MVKKFVFILLILSNIGYLRTYGQDQRKADSLAKIYKTPKLADSSKLSLLLNLCFNEVRDYDQAVAYAEELISLSQKTGDQNHLRDGYFLKGTKQRMLGQLEPALESFFTSLKLAQKQNNLTEQANNYSAIADTYSAAENQANTEKYYGLAIQMLRLSNDSISLAASLLNTGDELLKTKNYDTALKYLLEAKSIYEAKNYETGIAFSLGNLGVYYAKTGNSAEAKKNIDKAILILEAKHDYYPVCDFLLAMTDVYFEKGQIQDAIQYSKRSLALAQQYSLIEQISNASDKLSSLYQTTGNAELSLHFYKLHIQYRDSLNNVATVQRMADLRTDFEVSQVHRVVVLLTQQKKNERSLSLALMVIALLAIIIVIIMVKINKHKKKAYSILADQKQQTEKEKTKAENALTELLQTQKQLIQSAKMASMGELTAGIAHEIQNPLNFVTNFSEVNTELIAEMNKEIDKGNFEEVKIIVKDIEANEQKIGFHGKRADSIVKSMLQHSRNSSGTKELTDINALCDEFFRLSYHGLRAKDKSFNATMKTDFDNTIGKINIIPQDIGRVILNLINNAFYVVDEKKKSGLAGYEPTVSISTKKMGNQVEIKVSDNGNGIPKKVLDKIFHPFFTTKPTGEGTGLGLSLSYEIVTNGHGGELKVETKEGNGLLAGEAGTQFIIILNI